MEPASTSLDDDCSTVIVSNVRGNTKPTMTTENEDDLSALSAIFATVMANSSQLESAGEVSKILYNDLDAVPFLVKFGKTGFFVERFAVSISGPKSLFDNVEKAEANRLLVKVAQSKEDYEKFLRAMHKLHLQISQAELAEIQEEEVENEEDDEEDNPPVSSIGSGFSNERTNATSSVGMYSPMRHLQTAPVQEYPANTDGNTDSTSVVERANLAGENARRGKASAASTASTETDSAAEAGHPSKSNRGQLI